MFWPSACVLMNICPILHFLSHFLSCLIHFFTCLTHTYTHRHQESAADLHYSCFINCEICSRASVGVRHPGLVESSFLSGEMIKFVVQRFEAEDLVSLWKTAHEHLALYFGGKVCLRFILLMQVMLTLLIFLPSSVE